MLCALGSVLIAAMHVRWVLLLSIALLWWIVLGSVIYLAARGADRDSKRPPQPRAISNT
jgi:hypothetical protein